MRAAIHRAPGPKETARVLAEEPKAAEQKQANGTPDELDGAIGECRLLAMLQARLAKYGVRLFPLVGSSLLLSQPGGFTRTVPDLRVARELLKQWEAQ